VEKELEYRAYKADFTTREENGNGIIEGRAVVFDSVADFGDFGEVIDPAALDNCDMTDVRLCLNHDTNYVYARSRRNNGNSTMQLFKGIRGLDFDATLNIAGSPRAQDYYSAVSRGDMDKMSFGFIIGGVAWENIDTDYPIRRITEISRIIEISCVTFPAYDSTSIEARDAQTLEKVKRELENARAQRFNISVDTGELDLLKAKYEFKSKF
jgi:HK97 family phage prohead protease